MIAARIVSPQMLLDPIRGMHQRVILRHGPQIEPDRAQSIERPERSILGNVEIVVPDITGLNCGSITGEDNRNERESSDDRILEPGAIRSRDSRGGLPGFANDFLSEILPVEASFMSRTYYKAGDRVPIGKTT